MKKGAVLLAFVFTFAVPFIVPFQAFANDWCC
ncbi:hypothetical protein EDD58_10182 [Hazenella coriacea]|uniref:Uncharacterized protein n=1 Tax=Hazenella coriacea TaxID=1179467 RepID=A0A4R3L9R3_9BACL|nr:hypothetical protein EDD58_10182 [Hazenella coriacea]